MRAKRLERIHSALVSGCRRFDHPARSGWHALITPCLTGRGWRVTRFDDDGPFGHCEALSQWDGVANYLADWQFTEPCPKEGE